MALVIGERRYSTLRDRDTGHGPVRYLSGIPTSMPFFGYEAFGRAATQLVGGSFKRPDCERSRMNCVQLIDKISGIPLASGRK